MDCIRWRKKGLDKSEELMDVQLLSGVTGEVVCHSLRWETGRGPDLGGKIMSIVL